MSYKITNAVIDGVEKKIHNPDFRCFLDYFRDCPLFDELDGKSLTAEETVSEVIDIIIWSISDSSLVNLTEYVRGWNLPPSDQCRKDIRTALLADADNPKFAELSTSDCLSAAVETVGVKHLNQVIEQNYQVTDAYAAYYDVEEIGGNFYYNDRSGVNPVKAEALARQFAANPRKIGSFGFQLAHDLLPQLNELRKADLQSGVEMPTADLREALSPEDKVVLGRLVEKTGEDWRTVLWNTVHSYSTMFMGENDTGVLQRLEKRIGPAIYQTPTKTLTQDVLQHFAPAPKQPSVDEIFRQVTGATPGEMDAAAFTCKSFKADLRDAVTKSLAVQGDRRTALMQAVNEVCCAKANDEIQCLFGVSDLLKPRNDGLAEFGETAFAATPEKAALFQKALTDAPDKKRLMTPAVLAAVAETMEINVGRSETESRSYQPTVGMKR